VKRHLSILITGLVLSVAVLLPAAHAATATAKLVYVITNRGCEEVCRSFQHGLENQGPVTFVLRDADGDTARVPALIEEAHRLHADLIATWGTGITLAVVGPYGGVGTSGTSGSSDTSGTSGVAGTPGASGSSDTPNAAGMPSPSSASGMSDTPSASRMPAYVSDIPVVYMYVGNPVESKIARDEQHSGRANVAGANTSVPMQEQINLLTSYRKFSKVGMLYNANEPAALAQAASARRAFQARGVQVVEAQLKLDRFGRPNAADIPGAVATLAQSKPDFLYHIGSTFTLQQIAAISDAAIANGIPMFSSSESAFRNGDVLLGLVSSLAAIGEVSAYQAGQILFHGQRPGELTTPTVTRHSVLINMHAARALQLYPPMKLLQFAELDG
jgi:putative ABC transport system substrate-binding protein